MDDVRFFIALLLNGCFAGMIYAVGALAFVCVYKATRCVNFALGEWMSLGTLLTALALDLAPVGLPAAIMLAVIGMIAFAAGFNVVVVRHLTGRPPIAFIMVTLGLGALMRGSSSLAFHGIQSGIASPFASTPMPLLGTVVPPEKLVPALCAVICLAGVGWFYGRSRTGLALRAMAISPALASACGIGVARHTTIAWMLA